MKRNELLEARDLSEQDILNRIGELESKLFHLKFQMAIEGAQDNAEYSRTRKSLAQHKTLAREKELAREREPQAVGEQVEEEK